MANLQRPQAFKDLRQMPAQPFRAELGRLAIITASIDDIIHAIYWRFSGLDDVTGPLVTRDMKPSRLADDLPKMATAVKISSRQIDDLRDIISNYKPLAETRNKLIHWTWGKLVKGNVTLEMPPHRGAAQTMNVTLPDIKTLGDDLVWIETRFDSHAMTDAELQAARTKLGQAADLYAPAPWL